MSKAKVVVMRALPAAKVAAAAAAGDVDAAAAELQVLDFDQLDSS